MGWESFGVVGFDLGPLLQGQKSIARRKTKGAGATISSQKVSSGEAMYSAVNTGFSQMVSSYK